MSTTHNSVQKFIQPSERASFYTARLMGPKVSFGPVLAGHLFITAIVGLL